MGGEGGSLNEHQFYQDVVGFGHVAPTLSIHRPFSRVLPVSRGPGFGAGSADNPTPIVVFTLHMSLSLKSRWSSVKEASFLLLDTAVTGWVW